MQQNSKTLLIISQSARALAVSAKKSGYQPVVMDCFADTETRSVSVECVKLDYDSHGFNGEQLSTSLESLEKYSFSGVVPGSGLENNISFIEFLAERYSLLGNDAQIWQQCSDAIQFSERIKNTGINYPKISRNISDNYNLWLIKESFSAGGQHVRYATERANLTDFSYFQSYIDGSHISVAVLADGKTHLIVGKSETYVVDRDAGDFRYAGAITLGQLDTLIETQLEEMISKLVQQFSLRGLVGIDVVIDKSGCCWLLELNPRPTASMELYENKQGLMNAHIRACQGNLSGLTRDSDHRGYQIYYAHSDLHIPAISWPDWVTDRPVADDFIRAGQPVCSIHAHADNKNTVQELLTERFACFERQMEKYFQAA